MGSDDRTQCPRLPPSYFNPRSPCGERPPGKSPFAWAANFNPRSPCGERQDLADASPSIGGFQSTLPVWGATGGARGGGGVSPISIHAPRVGSDEGKRARRILADVFQSTLPVWGATFLRPWAGPPITYFNPRSPCGERPDALSPSQTARNFNPRSPCGERLLPASSGPEIADFNPRSPCGERPERQRPGST